MEIRRWTVGMADAQEVLASIPLFAQVLDEEQLERLAAKCHEVVFPPGAVLMTEGDFGTSMFALVEGEVSVTLADKRGDTHGVADLSAGEFVGEMSLLTGARRSATVAAKTEVVALEITKVALEEILARAPDLIDQFGLVLSWRQAELDRAAADVANANKDDLVSQIKRFFGGS
jgi:CRP/FNR family cyclic AMP-dependent transcriptional regulator